MRRYKMRRSSTWEENTEEIRTNVCFLFSASDLTCETHGPGELVVDQVTVASEWRRPNLGQFLLPLHGGLYRVALLGAVLRVHPAARAEELLLLGAHLLDQVISDVLQDGVLGRRLQNVKKPSEFIHGALNDDRRER